MKKSPPKEPQKLRLPPEVIREVKKLLRKDPKEVRYAYWSPEAMEEWKKLSSAERKRIRTDLSRRPARVKPKVK
jgi:mRNA-degrading endonuclease RelE of RelBE toxin-antitoxin system